MDSMIERRLAHFKISRRMIRDSHEAVIELLCRLQIIIVRAEFYWDSDTISYTAISPFWDTVPFNVIPPTLEIVGDGSHSFLFREVEK